MSKKSADGRGGVAEMKASLDKKPTRPLTAADLCDRCSARAAVETVMMQGGSLLWCAQHFAFFEDALNAFGATILVDERRRSPIRLRDIVAVEDHELHHLNDLNDPATMSRRPILIRDGAARGSTAGTAICVPPRLLKSYRGVPMQGATLAEVGMEIEPSSTGGKPGLCDISQTWPSRSVK